MLDVIAFLSVASPICVHRLCFVSIAWSPVVLVSPRGGRNGRLNRRLGRLNRQFSRSSRIELVRLSLVRIVVVSPQFRCYVVSIFVQPLPSSYCFMHLYFSESIGTLLSRFVCSIFIDNWHIDRCNDGLIDITFRYFGAVACFNIVFVSSIRLLRSSFILFTISLDRRAYNFSFDIACNIRSILSLTLRSTVRLTSGSTLRTTLRVTLRLTLCLNCIRHCIPYYVGHRVSTHRWHIVATVFRHRASIRHWHYSDFVDFHRLIVISTAPLGRFLRSFESYERHTCVFLVRFSWNNLVILSLLRAVWKYSEYSGDVL